MRRVYAKEEVCIGCHLCEVYCQLQHAQSKDLVKTFKRESPIPLPRLRIKRLIDRNNNVESDELIKCDGLVIDHGKCEVTVEGRIVELTFKEYELLRFLARNRGRVFTRTTLLNRVWGYDYYGGDRTVDVHVRRLRSKIEDANHNFIETVRNIGYRFKKNL